MKRFFLFLLLLLPSLALAQPAAEPAASHIWEAAAFGEKPGITHVKIQGINPAMAATFEVVWGENSGTTYVPQVAALSTPYCASTSVNDTSAGTGARTISVTGVTTAFARFTETVTMNGQTSVNLATSSVLFIDKITVLTAGSGLLNAGVIACGTGANTSGDPAVVHQYLGVSSDTVIPAAGAGFGNVSQSFFYGVPASHTLICKNLTASAYLATAVGFQAAVEGYTNSTGVVKRYAYVAGNTTGASAIDPSTIVFPEKTLIVGKMASTGAAVGMLSMECLLVNNTWEDTGQGIF